MRYILLGVFFLILNNFFQFDGWSVFAILLFVWQFCDFFEKLNQTIAFKEFILLLYSLNYLFAPAILFHYGLEYQLYKLKIPPEQFFPMTIPSLVLMKVGMNMFRRKSGIGSSFLLSFDVNAVLFRQWVFIGIALSLIKTLLPEELAFFVYLLSLIKYVAVFGLFAINKRKYLLYLLAVFTIEMFSSLREGMFGESVMWIVMFGIYWCYLSKPTALTKLSIAFFGIAILFVLQITKSDYRQQTWFGNEEASFETLRTLAAKKIDNNNSPLSEQNITNTLFRVNQGWIFASSVDRMEKNQDFQRLFLVNKYLEAAFLPRFLAPNKLKAGDKEIFNRFSGQRISRGTSMGLGIFADGYIAFGFYGVLLFSFVFGVAISLVFRIVDGWAQISPFFVLFAFPILNYAARPDCETQTLIGHLVKGTFLFATLMWYYKQYFTKKIQKERRRVAYEMVFARDYVSIKNIGGNNNN